MKIDVQQLLQSRKKGKKEMLQYKGSPRCSLNKISRVQNPQLTIFLDDFKNLGKHTTQQCADSVPVGKHGFL